MVLWIPPDLPQNLSLGIRQAQATSIFGSDKKFAPYDVAAEVVQHQKARPRQFSIRQIDSEPGTDKNTPLY